MTQGEATVVKNAGSHYELSELPVWRLFPAVLRGRIRLKASQITNPVAVGDHVRYELPDGEDTAVITEILPRENYVIRRSTNLSRQAHIIAANIDMAYLVVSLYFPEIKLPFLDRILVTCGVYGIPATIILSKVDMYREMAQEQVDAFHAIYEGAGYRVVDTSVVTGEGIDALRDSCQGKVNLFSGESGVGKSSLIKALDPSLDPKIGRFPRPTCKESTRPPSMRCTRWQPAAMSLTLRGFAASDWWTSRRRRSGSTSPKCSAPPKAAGSRPAPIRTNPAAP